MKKLYVMLCIINLFFSCESNFNIESNLNKTDSSQNNSIEYNVLGMFLLSSDSSEYLNPIPYIEFYKFNKCIVLVNYFQGEAVLNGIYIIENNFLTVNLNIKGTIFDGVDELGNKYMEDEYVFEIIENNKIVIDKGFYTVKPGDLFVRQPID